MTHRRWLEARAPRGMVASPHALASASGVAALRAGGNALDATIAVVYPHMNGVGGDNFWLIYNTASLDSSAPAPSRQRRPRAASSDVTSDWRSLAFPLGS